MPSLPRIGCYCAILAACEPTVSSLEAPTVHGHGGLHDALMNVVRHGSSTAHQLAADACPREGHRLVARGKGPTSPLGSRASSIWAHLTLYRPNGRNEEKSLIH